MSTSTKPVPLWLRGLVFLLGLANVAFGVMGYFSTGQLFKDLSSVPGLTADSPLLVHASQEFSSRNLAIGLALLIVALVGVPESIAIVGIIRALIEIQSISQALFHGETAPTIIMPAVFLVIDLVIVVTAFRIVKRAESQ